MEQEDEGMKKVVMYLVVVVAISGLALAGIAKGRAVTAEGHKPDAGPEKIRRSSNHMFGLAKTDCKCKGALGLRLS